MIFNGKEVEFPAIGKVSFFKVYESLEKLAKDEDKVIARAAKDLLEDVKEYPELRDGIESGEDLGKYQKPIKKLARILFPDVLSTNEIKALAPPFIFEPLYCSDRFKSIVEGSEGQLTEHLMDVDEDSFYLYCCYFILASYYHFPSHGGGPLSIEVFNKNLGFHRSYQMAINVDLIQFEPTENAVDITREDFELLVDNHNDIKLWKEKFPPNSWIMKGITIINLMDITNRESISKITSNLLLKSEESMKNIREGMRSLFTDPDLRSGVVTVTDGILTQVQSDDMKSIILGSSKTMDCEKGFCGFSLEAIMHTSDPIVIPDVASYHKQSKSQLSQSLLDQKIQSYIMIPLIFEEELLGFMELGSAKVYELNSISISKLEPLVPILAMAMKRFKTEEQNLVEAIIQQECTTIHSSVKWRFEEEAKRFLHSRYAGNQPNFKDIVFKEVVPLFGQLDIKGSSARRNEAIKSDILAQIEQVRKILKQAQSMTKVTAYEELLFRMNGFRKSINSSITAGIEHEFNAFVKDHINPALGHLRTLDKKLDKLVSTYEKSLDPELHIIYNERKKYDQSVNKINHALAGALDEKQQEAQEIFPHYYERYKTDGVEYNMYIGQSMTKEGNYDPIYLRNLRIWQMTTMWSLENDFKNLTHEMDMDVEIASMILAYSTPLAVHFRMDEKRFDVEGAYNARYEIVKSRIDKAHIKGTNERIRQPGKLSIIYSHENDAAEYRQFIAFLQSKGYFKNKVEDLELEDLQGIHGLRALRIDINYTKEKSEASLDDFIKSIEQVS